MASKKKAPGKSKLTDLKPRKNPKGGITLTQQSSAASPSLFQAPQAGPLIPVLPLPGGVPTGGSKPVVIVKESGSASPNLFSVG